MEDAELAAIGLLPAQASAELERIGDGSCTVDIKLTAGEHPDQRQIGAKSGLPIHLQAGLIYQDDRAGG